MFSLKKLVTGDLNQPAPGRVAPPRPASTAQPSLRVGVAAPQQLQVGNQMIAPSRNVRSGVADPYKAPNFVQQAQGIGKNFVDSAKLTGQKTARLGQATTAGVVGLGNIGLQSAFGTDQSYQDALQKTNAAINAPLNRGSYLTPQQAGATGGGTKSLVENYIKPTAIATAEIAPYAIPIGGVTGIGGKGALATRAYQQGLANTVIGGGSNAALQQAQTGKVDLGQVGQAAAISGLVGTAAPVAGAALRAGGQATTKLVNNAAPLDEAGFAKVPGAKPNNVPTTKLVPPREPAAQPVQPQLPLANAVESKPLQPSIPVAKANGDAYEAAIAQQLQNNGYTLESVGKAAGKQDGGIDNIAKNPNETLVIQNKYRSRDTTIHLSTVAQIQGAAERYARAHPGENVVPTIYATKPMDPEALVYAQQHGVRVIQTGLKGEQVAQQAALKLPKNNTQLTPDDLIAMQNSVPMADRADLIKQLSDPNSTLSKRVASVSPENAHQLVRKYYQGLNPQGSYELNQSRAIGAKLAQAKTPAEVEKILKGSKSDTPLTQALAAKLNDKNFIAQLVAEKTKSGQRKLLNSILDKPVYEPVKSASQVDKIANAASTARKAGADDKQIKKILEQGVGSNRDAAARLLEKNQANLTNADRLALTGGDTGQAGLQLPAKERNAMLKKFQAQAAEQQLPIVGNSLSAKPRTSKLNTSRLDVGDKERVLLDQETQTAIDRMTNDEVMQTAKSAGLDVKTHSPEQTRQLIAEQLNVRRDAVRLLKEAHATKDKNARATLLRQAAERGRTSREQGTDLARQLQARKIIANELDTPEQRIFKLLDAAGVNPEVYSKRLAEVDFTKPKQVVAAYRELVPAKATQWLDVVRYNSMLSSPLTQAVNIFGNAQNVALVAPIEKTLRGGIDALGGLFGKERQYVAGEGAAYAKGAATNIKKASTNFVDALRGTGQYANLDLEEYSIPLAQGGVKGGIYQGLSIPMRVLDGMDKFFRTLADSGEEAALVAREKAGIAIKGNRQAIKEAEQAYRVFQTELGTPGQGVIDEAFDEFAKIVMRGRNSKNPLVALPSKFSVPFVKTINNISKQGMVDFTPLGFVNLKGNADKTTALTRAIMGSAVFGTSAALIAQGQMTWAEPRDPEERARFRAEGKQPYAVKIGDKWVNFSKLTPSVSFPMAMTAALHDAMESKKLNQSNVDSILEAVAKYGNFLSDQSYAKSIGDTLGAVGGDTEAVASAASNYIQQVIPERAFTGWIARITDDKERKVDTTKGYFDQQVQAFMQQYPGLRSKTATRDYKGSPISANNQVFNGFSPVKVTKDRGVDPVDAAKDAAKLATTEEPDLNKQQKAQLKKFTQARVQEYQAKLVASQEFKQLDEKGKAKALDKANSQVTHAMARQFRADNNIPINEKATKADLRILNEYNNNTATATTDSTSAFTASKPSGGSTIAVNKNIDKHSQKVLNEYNTLDAATIKKKTYAEPDYEYKVAQAKYDNKLANGEYSTAQRISAADKLKKAEAGKTFNKNTRELYELSKDDLADYLASSPEGNREAADLIAYDKALVDKSVIAKAKFKNGIISHTASVGGKGGRGKKYDYATRLAESNKQIASTDKALRDLVGRTRTGTGGKRKATVARVALKKQNIKKRKAQVA